MGNSELSRPWSQPEPRSATQGHADVTSLYNECNEAQQERRTKAFNDARRFIDNAVPQGVKTPVSTSFKNRNLPQKFKDSRVDLEVKAGIAFIP
ncbi:hypothetical protein [Myxococcus fulvus]|uniref:hypothetical protein n=1 Tax=Myxococcus fulvus TaxID=33 RepID=UPI0020BF102E|nr:hypothetical protein [Myxococcus fulvus]MCK8502038.1 hypothetical protein [Myxococcus fulvus]